MFVPGTLHQSRDRKDGSIKAGFQRQDNRREAPKIAGHFNDFEDSSAHNEIKPGFLCLNSIHSETCILDSDLVGFPILLPIPGSVMVRRPGTTSGEFEADGGTQV